MELEQTSLQAWVKLRSNAVRNVYTAFQCLSENGHGELLADDQTAVQMSCPYHGVDATPSARYYPRSGGRSDNLRCYKCRENWDSINLYMKFKGLRFMDALQDLERRFRIKIPRRPEGPVIVEPVDRSSQYTSDKWQDIPRVISMLEAKLLRIREKCGLTDYIKFCRVIDAISYDYDKSLKVNPGMVTGLQKLIIMMDDVVSLPENFGSMNYDNNNPI